MGNRFSSRTGRETTVPSRKDGESRPTPEVVASLQILEVGTSNESHVHRAAIREIFVQYDPDNHYSLAEFGASICTIQESDHKHKHILREVDGTGLAWKAGLRNGDVLLAFNNAQKLIIDVSQRAILESLKDVGTRIAFLVQRFCEGKKKYGWFAFRLGVKDGRPTIIYHHHEWLGDEQIKDSFVIILPPEVAYTPLPQYLFQESVLVNVTLTSNDRFLTIDPSSAYFGTNTVTLQMLKYNAVTPDPPRGSPVAFATPDSMRSRCRPDGSGNEVDVVDCEEDDMCISGQYIGSVNVEGLPAFMTDKKEPITENDMFFFLLPNDDDSLIIKSSNTVTDLYLSDASDGTFAAVLAAERTNMMVIEVTKRKEEVVPELTHCSL